MKKIRKFQKKKKGNKKKGKNFSELSAWSRKL